MDSITIQHATLSDLDALIEIENHFTTDKISKTSFRTLLKKDSAIIYLAKIHQHLVGYILVLFRKNSQTARIYSLVVRPEHRKLGIALQLCKAAENIAIKHHCTSMILEVRPDNHAAIQFYLKHHYHELGKYRKFYEDGADAIRMKKALK